MSTEKQKQWEQMSRDDLLVIAKESGVNVPGNIGKEKLIEKLVEVAEASPDVEETDILEQMEEAEQEAQEELPEDEGEEVETDPNKKRVYSEEEVKTLIKDAVKDIKEEVQRELREELAQAMPPKGMSTEEMKKVVASQITFTKKQLDEGEHVLMIIEPDEKEKRLAVAYESVGINGVIRKYKKGVEISVPKEMAKLINNYRLLKNNVGDEMKIDRPKSADDKRPYSVREALEADNVQELS
jgi:hypothetical protein